MENQIAPMPPKQKAKKLIADFKPLLVVVIDPEETDDDREKYKNHLSRECARITAKENLETAKGCNDKVWIGYWGDVILEIEKLM